MLSQSRTWQDDLLVGIGASGLVAVCSNGTTLSLGVSAIVGMATFVIRRKRRSLIVGGEDSYAFSLSLRILSVFAASGALVLLAMVKIAPRVAPSALHVKVHQVGAARSAESSKRSSNEHKKTASVVPQEPRAMGAHASDTRVTHPLDQGQIAATPKGTPSQSDKKGSILCGTTSASPSPAGERVLTDVATAAKEDTPRIPAVIVALPPPAKVRATLTSPQKPANFISSSPQVPSNGSDNIPAQPPPAIPGGGDDTQKPQAASIIATFLYANCGSIACYNFVVQNVGGRDEAINKIEIHLPEAVGTKVARPQLEIEAILLPGGYIDIPYAQLAAFRDAVVVLQRPFLVAAGKIELFQLRFNDLAFAGSPFSFGVNPYFQIDFVSGFVIVPTNQMPIVV